MMLEKALLEKIYGRISIDEETTMCCRYLGGNNGQGYGRMWDHGKMQSVHRVMYAVFHGPIPADKEVHHLCGMRDCCNIAHLTLVTHRENILLIPHYAQLRWERLRTLVETHLDLALCGTTHLTSTDFAVLWGTSCRGGNLLTYLTTLADVYPGEFAWSLVRPGRGKRPHLFEMRMSQTLIDRLTESEERGPSDVKTTPPAEDALYPLSSLVLAV